jgi:hypothetical protein
MVALVPVNAARNARDHLPGHPSIVDCELFLVAIKKDKRVQIQLYGRNFNIIVADR